MFVDGYNLYNGLKSLAKKEHSKRHYWIDLKKLTYSCFPQLADFDISCKYYTSRTTSDSKAMQEKWLKAVREQGLEIIYGAFSIRKLEYHLDARKSITISFRKYTEKQTDVKIALGIANEACMGNTTIVIISADEDLLPAIEYACEKKAALYVLFPPERGNRKIEAFCKRQSIERAVITKDNLQDCLLENPPDEWSN